VPLRKGYFKRINYYLLSTARLFPSKNFKTNYTIHHSTFPADYGNDGRFAHYTYLLSLTSHFRTLSCFFYKVKVKVMRRQWQWQTTPEQQISPRKSSIESPGV
jgi:hypothetical protein